MNIYEKQMNIYEKLSKITEEIGVVAKNLSITVGKNNKYKAVGETDVLNAVKPIEAKYKVYSYPRSREITDRDILTNEREYNGTVTKTNSLFCRIKTIYRFVNVENPDEYIETEVFSDGIDTGDKGCGKAMTYADKYALMKAYKIVTGDDPDVDASPEQGYTKAEAEHYYCKGKGCGVEIDVIQAGLTEQAYGKPLCKACEAKAKAYYDNLPEPNAPKFKVEK